MFLDARNIVLSEITVKRLPAGRPTRALWSAHDLGEFSPLKMGTCWASVPHNTFDHFVPAQIAFGAAADEEMFSL